ncbi:MAG: dihydrodipicolinate reductase [Bryobacterales bacterium]|jgi:4-hydroxy-tetrahydrodipicolinate reductase|nr:dihydrodipicolinate reductase [Bryobacterales bacterium]
MESRKRLALVGHGKMGRRIEQLAVQHGFSVVLKLTSANNQDAAGINSESFRDVDVAIEFSSPHAAVANLIRLAELKIPAVTGTTGWLDHLPAVTRQFEKTGAGLVWSPNFSVSIAVFQRLAGLAAELFQAEEQYGAWAWEIHHDAKKDAPSGTLLQLVKTMQRHGYSRPIDTSSSRAGKHPGTHEIGFDSEADTLTLRHVARSRDGFVHGALKAANWIIGRPGVYTFEDVLFGEHSR